MAAYRAAFGNPDRAFEYLMSGGGGGANQSEFADDYGDEEGGEPVGAGAGAGAGANPFAALAGNPNFAMIRQRILQDPNFYNQFMQ